MIQSVSAVEYRMVNDQRVTVLDLKVAAIEKMFTKCTSLFNKAQGEVTTSTEWEYLSDKISAIKPTLEDQPPRPAGIQLLFQILLGLIVIGLVLILVFGTGVAVMLGSLLSLIVVVLLSLLILLFSLINPVVHY